MIYCALGVSLNFSKLYLGVWGEWLYTQSPFIIPQKKKKKKKKKKTQSDTQTQQSGNIWQKRYTVPSAYHICWTGEKK